MMDLIIEDEKKHPDSNKWTKEDIIGNINLIYVAGADTSNNFMKSTLMYISKYPEVASFLREQYARLKTSKTFTLEDIVNDRKVDMVS